MPLPRNQFMPEGAQADMAKRQAEYLRGGVPEVMKQAAMETYHNPIVNNALAAMPVVGDAMLAGDVMDNWKQGNYKTAIGQALTGALPYGGLIGKTVWHGSPHAFNKFDMGKIGTGEGAQAYGHGLYLADAPQTAKSYAKPTIQDIRITPEGKMFDLNTGETVGPVHGFPKHEEVLHGKEGNLYKVDLPDEQIAKMLDWDKPLSEQPHVMKFINDEEAKRTKSVLDQRIKTLESMGESHPNAANVKKQIALLEEEMANPMGSGLGTLTGGEYFDYLRRREIDPKAQAEMFMQQGIPGIQYLDQASRGAGEGTRNYVVFDDKIPQILERNGSPLVDALRETK